MITLLMMACNGDSPAEQPPTLNYIPDYSDACLPTFEEYNAAREATLPRIETDTFLVAHHFEVCSDDMTSSCAPCSTDPAAGNYNALAHVIEEFDVWASAESIAALAATGVTPEMFPLIFEQALAYPWRHLLVHGVPGEGSLSLSPGIAQPCVLDNACGEMPEYQVGLGALDEDCSSFRNTLGVEWSGEADITTLAPGDRAFGFQVPLVHPDDMPPAEDFDSVREIEQWLLGTPKVTARVDAPALSVERVGEKVCGRMTGHLDPSVLADFLAEPTALDAYRDHTGGIPATLTLELHATAVAPVEEL